MHPGPQGVWLLGNVFDVLRYGRHGVMAKWSKIHEGNKLGKIFFGARSFLVTDDPTAARWGIETLHIVSFLAKTTLQ